MLYGVCAQLLKTLCIIRSTGDEPLKPKKNKCGKPLATEAIIQLRMQQYRAAVEQFAGRIANDPECRNFVQAVIGQIKQENSRAPYNSPNDIVANLRSANPVVNAEDDDSRFCTDLFAETQGSLLGFGPFNKLYIGWRFFFGALRSSGGDIIGDRATIIGHEGFHYGWGWATGGLTDVRLLSAVEAAGGNIGKYKELVQASMAINHAMWDKCRPK